MIAWLLQGIHVKRQNLYIILLNMLFNTQESGKLLGILGVYFLPLT